MRRYCVFAAVVLLIAAALSSCSRQENPFDAQKSARTPAYNVAGSPPAITATLIAAQKIDAGEVSLWLVGDVLNVEFSTTGGWLLTETHLAVASSVDEIPVTPSGNPIPGQFPFKDAHAPPVSTFEYSLDMDAAGLADAEMLYVAARATVQKVVTGGLVREESAWGNGDRFRPLPEGDKIKRKGNWAMYFPVDVAQLRGLLLWNKLGSAGEVGNSEVGPGGNVTGDLQYLPCVYDDGFKALPRTGDHNVPDNYIDFHDVGIGPQGCVEFWYHPTWNNPSVGHVVELIWFGLPFNQGDPDIPLCFDAQYNDWQDLLSWDVWNVVDGHREPGNLAYVQFRPSTTPGWSTTEPFHMALVWDGTAPNPNDRAQIYINGNRVGTSSHVGNPTFSAWPGDFLLRVGSRLQTGDWNRHHWENADGVIDNIKVWSYAKTDFSDRFEE